MRILFCLQVVVFCIVYPVSVYAAELIAPAITGLLDKDGKGPYQIIMREAAARAGISFTEKFYPQRRALKTFCDNKNSCIYSYTEPAAEVLGKNRIIASVPLGVFRMHIFTRKGEPPLTSAEHLKNKKRQVSWDMRNGIKQHCRVSDSGWLRVMTWLSEY